MEVDEAAVFAPVKNGDGADRDTPTTVRKQMVKLHRRWLEGAGAKVADGVSVEISPLFAVDAAEVAAKVNAGSQVDSDKYFQ